MFEFFTDSPNPTRNVYLVKKKVEHRVIRLFGRVGKDQGGDGTHWAVKVGGRYYHLTGADLNLDTKDISDKLVKWKHKGQWAKEHKIGETRLSDDRLHEKGECL